ncbi:MAG: exosortase, partial [Planctomycetota bacterium]
LIVFQAQTMLPPDINMLINAHKKVRADLTVMLNPPYTNHLTRYNLPGIYICQPTVLDHIPKQGYYDIKEGLIPAMLRAGATVRAAVLTKPAANFTNRQEYLTAMAAYLDSKENRTSDLPGNKFNNAKDIYVADSAKISPRAKIYGPAIVMDNTDISENAVIFGPAIIGSSVEIQKNTLIENCAIWDGARIGQNCHFQSCIVNYHAIIPDNTTLSHQAVAYAQSHKLRTALTKPLATVSDKARRFHTFAAPRLNKINEKLPTWMRCERSCSSLLKALALSILVALFMWSYWPQLIDLWGIWQRSDEYSCGLLVPFLAVYVLYARRQEITKVPLRPCIYGLFALIAVQALRYFGLFFMYSSAERLSVPLSIASLTLLLFGWRLLIKILPVLLFLFLMLPLPQSVHRTVMLPLQNLATASAVFCLEIMGYAVIREGNIIHLNDTTVAVAEACNGLRMVTAFFVVITLVVLLVRREWWEKMIILVSNLPIALLCNILRLTITAMAFTVVTGEKWEEIFHDFGGYLMMPLALAVVTLELWLLKKLTTVGEKVEQKIIVQRAYC